MKESASMIDMKQNEISWRQPFERQVAELLLRSIKNGTWKKRLPPERELCEVVSVSRPVLRRAIHLLENAGVVRIQPGHPTRIVSRGRNRRMLDEPSKWILLHCEPLEKLGSWLLILIDELRRRSYERGCQFEIVHDLRLKSKRPGRLLQKLVQERGTARWILSSVSLEVQRWFQEKEVPAIVTGTAFPGVDLSSVDDDLPAVTRHAAGLLVRRGHRRIVYLIRGPGLAGEKEAGAAFLAAGKAVPESGFLIQQHSGEPRQIRSILDRVLARSDAPTAIFISHGNDFLIALTYLTSRGWRFPDDISLLSRGTEKILEGITPLPTRYEIDPLLHARYLCRLLENPPPKLRRIRLIPSFAGGETVGPPPRKSPKI